MKKDIKIFVSRRIDQDSKIINNPLFMNVRCGAIFDDNQNSKYLGDDTGENISDKRKSFCELTVQYWAWKNQKADYYGLCHYRRFLSFSEQVYSENKFGVVEYPIIDSKFIDQFRLSENYIRQEVEKYDVITNSLIPVSLSGDYKSVYDYCVKNPSGYFEKDIKILFEVIKDLYPQDYEIAKQFFEGDKNCWYNCFVMKANIFDEYSKWLFDILFELEKRIDIKDYTQEQMRMCGVLGERLWGIYLKKLEGQGVKIAYKQLVYIQDTIFDKKEKIKVSDDDIPIVLPVDENSIALAVTTIRSIIDTSIVPQKLKFFLLRKGCIDMEKQLLSDFEKDEAVNIKLIDTTYFINRYKDRCGVIDDAIGNMFSVFDVCSELDKIIYISPGMVFKDDVEKLYKYNIGKSWIGAVIDPIILTYAYNTFNVVTGYDNKYLCKELNLGKFKYYNTDLLVLRPLEIMKVLSVSAIIDNFNLHKYIQPYSDCINEVFKEHIFEINMKWNSYFDNKSYLVDWVRWFIPNRIYEEFCRGINNPAVINYCSAFPIKNIQDVGKMSELWKYAKKTSFYEYLFMQIQFLFTEQPQITTSRLQHLVEFLFPLGSRRRMVARKLVPRNSKRWYFLKKIYHTVKR